MSEVALAPYARRQHGLITRQQALSVLSASTLERRIRSRRLEPVRRGVYRVGGAPETWPQHLLAVCLAAGPRAHASFRSAAALHALEQFAPDVLEITTFGGRSAAIDGVVVHESSVFDPTHLTVVSGIPTTSMARTLCDLTAVSPAWVVGRAVDEALRRKVVQLKSIARVAATLDHQGRHRGTVMRQILERRLPGYEPGESAPERRIANLLPQAGLPTPVLQHRVRLAKRTVRIDLAYPDAKIAIEYDGWDHHSTRAAFDRDRSRANELVLAGWCVLRFTSEATDAQIVASIEAALRRASAS